EAARGIAQVFFQTPLYEAALLVSAREGERRFALLWLGAFLGAIAYPHARATAACGWDMVDGEFLHRLSLCVYCVLPAMASAFLSTGSSPVRLAMPLNKATAVARASLGGKPA